MKRLLKKSLQISLSTVVLILTCSAPGYVQARALERFSIHGDRLFVKANNISLFKLIQVVSEKTGTEVYIFENIEDVRTSVAFDGETVEVVLGHLLFNYDHAIVYTMNMGHESNDKSTILAYKKPGLEKGSKESLSESKSQSGRDDYPAGGGVEPGDSNVTPSTIQIAGTTGADGTGAFVEDGTYPSSVQTGGKADRGGVQGATVHFLASTGSSRNASANAGVHVYTPDSESGGSDVSHDTKEPEYIADLEYAARMIDPDDDDAKRALLLQYRIETLKARIQNGESDRHYDKWTEIRGEKYIVHDQVYLEQYQTELAKLSQ